MANLGTDFSTDDLRCSNCGAAIESTIVVHGQSRETLARSMDTFAALGRAVLHTYYAEHPDAPLLCKDCAPPAEETTLQRRVRRLRDKA